MKDNPVTPYRNRLSKKEQVAGMFNHIAPRYDFLNHFLSLGIDKIWRKKVINTLKKDDPKQMLDVATGTGDLAIAAARSIKNLHVEATDIAAVMLDHAKLKVSKARLESQINVTLNDAEDLKFENNRFDAITAAFGVRNFEDVSRGLKEMHRVLKPGGKIIILEFSKPRSGFFALLFNLYFKKLLPVIGNFFSGNNRAYSYLSESVEAFPEREDFIKLMQENGFHSCKYQSFTFGVACMYLGKK